MECNCVTCFSFLCGRCETSISPLVILSNSIQLPTHYRMFKVIIRNNLVLLFHMTSAVLAAVAWPTLSHSPRKSNDGSHQSFLDKNFYITEKSLSLNPSAFISKRYASWEWERTRLRAWSCAHPNHSRRQVASLNLVVRMTRRNVNKTMSVTRSTFQWRLRGLSYVGPKSMHSGNLMITRHSAACGVETKPLVCPLGSSKRITVAHPFTQAFVQSSSCSSPRFRVSEK